MSSRMPSLSSVCQSMRLGSRPDLDDDIQQSLRTVGRHQVVDVFYVTDRDGGKIEDHARLETIRSTITQSIDQFMGHPVDASEGVSVGTPS